MEEVKESVFDAQVRMVLEARKNERPDKELAERNFVSSLFFLAEKVVDICDRSLKADVSTSRIGVVEELVTMAYQKSERCDPNKGKPINFFTTVMLGHYRQCYRKLKKVFSAKGETNA